MKRYLINLIVIFMLGCFALQNAQADLLFTEEWNFFGNRTFFGKVKSVEESLKDKLMMKYIFNEKFQLIETQFDKDSGPHSFRYYYDSEGRLNKIELFDRANKNVISYETAQFNDNGEIVSFESYINGKLIQKSAVVICDENKRVQTIVYQDNENKIKELTFEYYPDGSLKFSKYSYDGKVLNTAFISQKKDNSWFEKKINAHDGVLTSNNKIVCQYDKEGNWITKTIIVDQEKNINLKINRKYEYYKTDKKWFFNLF